MLHNFIAYVWWHWLFCKGLHFGSSSHKIFPCLCLNHCLHMWICILNVTRISQWSTLHQEVPASFIPEGEEFQFRAALSRSIRLFSHPSKKAPGKDELHMAVVRCSAGYPSDFDRDYKQFTLDIRISLIMERIWNRSDSKGWWKSGSSELEQTCVVITCCL